MIRDEGYMKVPAARYCVLQRLAAGTWKQKIMGLTAPMCSEDSDLP